jgi:predicted PurR-regulated permease PerM
MDESGARRIYARIFLGLLALSVALLAVVVLRPFLPAIAWAIVLAVGGRAPWRWLEQRLAPHRSLAASLMCVGIALVVILPAALVGSVLVDQATHALTLLRDLLSRQQVSSVADVLALPWVTAALRWVEAWLGITPQWLLDRAGEAAAGLSTFVAAKGGGVVLGFVEALVTFVLTIFLLFFCFRDSETLVAAFADLLPVEAHERERIVSALGAMLQAMFRGALLCGLIQGATGGLGWGLAGLPSPVLAGSFMALTSLLPVGGTALVWLPGALWLWLGGSRGAAIFLGVWGAVLTSFVADNVLKPLLMRGAGELHTLVVLLGVFGGLSAFGLLGIFIGPMSLAVALMVLRVLRKLTAAGQRPSEERPD